MADDSGLSERQLCAVRLLVEGRTPTELCRELDVSRASFYEWKRLPAFKAALEAYQTEALRDVRLFLTALARPACETLQAAMQGVELGKDALSAARDVLDRVGASFTPAPEPASLQPVPATTGDPWGPEGTGGVSGTPGTA